MGKLNNQQVIQSLTSAFGGRISIPSEPYGLLTLETSSENISEVLRFLKEDKELKFNYLTDITAIHYPDQDLSIGVIYHLHSLTNNVRVRIKVFIDGQAPLIPTATNLWEGANWMERETFDFFIVNIVISLKLKKFVVYTKCERTPLWWPKQFIMVFVIGLLHIVGAL
jgi:NADH-quinone oxidoreductase subunit C